MIIYVDITLLNNFLMTTAIIWAIAKIMEMKISWARLILGANIANLYLIFAFLLQQIPLHYFISFILHILLNIISALLIVKVSFPDLDKARFIRAVTRLYLITFIAIGTTLSLFYIYGGSPFNTGILKLCIGLIVLFLLGNFGWSIIQKYKLPDELYLAIVIYFQGRELSLTGLLDTGNSLTDPFSNAPVIVAELSALLPLFPEKIQKQILSSANRDFGLIDIFQEYDLAQRIRLLPFSDLGQENGLMLGFRPDLVELFYKNKLLRIEDCVIGISKRVLDHENSYQALIHPKLII